MPLVSAIGGTVAISVATPGTFDVSGYAALSWTVITEVVSYGAIKDSAARVARSLLVDGRTSKVRGELTAEEIPIICLYLATDAGQDLVRANNNTATVVSMRFTNSSSHIQYNWGLIMDRATMPQDASADNAMEFTFVPNKAWVETGG